MHKILLMADDALALSGMALAATLTSVNQSMIPKSGSRFSEKIMLKEKLDFDPIESKSDQGLVLRFRSLPDIVARLMRTSETKEH